MKRTPLKPKGIKRRVTTYSPDGKGNLILKSSIHYPLKLRIRLKAKRKAKKRPKTKDEVWKLRKADSHFSKVIRDRDGKCMHPKGSENCKLLQNSHFIGRAVKSTRYDPDNCITLCWLHHYKSKDLGFEYQKQTIEKHGFDGQYTLFMKNLLKDRYAALIERSKQHVTQKAAILHYQLTLDK